MSNRVQIEYVLTVDELRQFDAAMHYDAYKPRQIELPFWRNPYQWPIGLLMLLGIFGICSRPISAIQKLPAVERLIVYLFVGIPWALIIGIVGLFVWKYRQSIMPGSIRTNPTSGNSVRFDISENGIAMETRLAQFFAKWDYVQNVKWCPEPAGFLIKTMGGTYWMPGSAFKSPELLDQFVSLVKGAGVQIEELPTGQ